MNNYQHSLKQIVGFLNRQGIPYMIVGGIANAVWGIARNTFDIDIIIDVEDDDLEKTIKKLTANFITSIENPVGFAKTFRVLPIRTTQGFLLDIIFAALEFEKAAIERAREQNLGGIKAIICSPEDLVILKIISNRRKDQEDVAGIIKIRGDSLDRKYLDKKIRELALWLDRSDIVDFYEQCWNRLKNRH
jgi:predicted nucleotidyltransferase